MFSPSLFSEEHGQDAYSAFSDFGNRNGFGNRAGAGSDLRINFPGLPADLQQRWRQHRLQLYVAASVQRVGLGPRGAMLDQSIFRTPDEKAKSVGWEQIAEVRMPRRPIELPPAVARRFVEDMRAFFAEESPIARVD
jgi:hypothetical protein